MSQDFNPNDLEVKAPDVSMKWHKFLIYFLIWVWIVFGVYNGIQDLQFAAHYDLSQIPGGFIIPLQGIGLLVAAVFAIKVWNDLRNLRGKAPKELSTYFIICLCCDALTVLFCIINSVPMDSTKLYPIAANVGALFWYRKYYNARDAYFVN